MKDLEIKIMDLGDEFYASLTSEGVAGYLKSGKIVDEGVPYLSRHFVLRDFNFQLTKMITHHFNRNEQIS